MRPMNLVPGQCRMCLVTWLALATLAASGAPVRTFSEPRTIPSNAWMVFSVPDLPAAWKALAATPIYQDAVALIENPTVSTFPAYRQFLEQKQQMEAELGFPVNAATLTAIVAGFDFIYLPPAESKGQPFPVCLFRAADAPRFRRLVDYIERKMGTPRERRATPTTSPTVVRDKYKNVEIVSTPVGSGFAVAQLGPNHFAMANHPNAIRTIIDQGQKSNVLATRGPFRNAVGGLNESEPHGFLYLNSVEMISSLRRGGLPGLPLSGLVRSLRDQVVMAADFRIENNAIRFEAFLPFADAAEDRLAALYQHYPPSQLRSLDYISSAPLVLTARNTLDGPALYETIRDMVLRSIRAVVGPGQSPEQRLKLQEENFREQMGFALKDDLAPAIGPEAFLSLERISFDPLLPLPTLDLVAGIEVRDPKRMGKVVTGFEKFLEQHLDTGEQREQPAALFQSVGYQGKTIKWFILPRAQQYSIGYAQTDRFILVGLGGDSIKRAMDRIEGRRKAFRAGSLHASLQPFLHKETNEVFVLNVPKMVAVGREVARRLPKNTPDQENEIKRIETILARLRRIAALGASTAGSASGLHTRGALVFTPAQSKTKTSK